MKLICKKCLLREMAEADAAMIKKYVDAIKGEDRVPEKEYEARQGLQCARRVTG